MQMSEMPSAPTLFQSLLSRLASDLRSNPHSSAPTTYEPWLRQFFPRHFAEFAPHHHDLWQWVDDLRLGVKPSQSFIGIFARGGGKSSSAEGAVAYVGAMRKRHYALYVRGTQEQADNSVDNIASLLESPVFGEYYPELSNKQIGKFGQTKGWRRNRLRTASGFTVDAFGLDTALRGVKVEERRPDLIVIDDADAKHDTISTTLKKIEKITTSILPAGSGDCAILGIQNLIISHGFFARMVDNTADYLYNRHVVGPIPAVRNLEVEQVWDEAHDKQRYRITGGEPTWAYQGLDVCEAQINDWGLISFLVEAQHDVDVVEGGTYAGVNYEHIRLDQCPGFKRTVVWVDPAVSDSDDADCMGIQVDALGVDKKIYRLYSWEDRASPEAVIKRAILKAYEYDAREVGFETDQGGVLWRAEYYRVYDLLVQEGKLPKNWNRPAFKSAKAGSIGSKRHRHNMQRSAYDRGIFVHVYGTHVTLENALKRFPVHKPYDLVDASYYASLSLLRFTGGWSKNYTGGETS
jgi:hypothetical protein